MEERFTTSDGQSSRESICRAGNRSNGASGRAQGFTILFVVGYEFLMGTGEVPPALGSVWSAATWEGWEFRQGLLGFVVFLSTGVAKSLE